MQAYGFQAFRTLAVKKQLVVRTLFHLNRQWKIAELIVFHNSPKPFFIVIQLQYPVFVKAGKTLLQTLLRRPFLQLLPVKKENVVVCRFYFR